VFEERPEIRIGGVDHTVIGVVRHGDVAIVIQ